MLGLLRTLQWLPDAYERADDGLDVPDEFLAPGFWAVLACFARDKSISADYIRFANPKARGYSAAVGLSAALGGLDDYEFARVNDGRFYSSLEHLAQPESTDQATQRVTQCIRNFFQDAGHDRFVSEMCGVVSELHSNVWDHGRGSGFSMAQRWTKSGQFEFALADCGMGFLAEVRRVGKPFERDDEAIDWCMQEGASTKKPNPDEWAQRVPDDAIGAPFPPSQRVYASEPNHAGLGLWKLSVLTDIFGGNTWVASGRSCLHLSPRGTRFCDIPPWKGVAIACKFSEERIRQAPADVDDPRVEAVMRMLRREP